MTESRVGHRRLHSAIGWVFAVACLAWIFHDLSPTEVWRSMRGLRWVWVLPAVAADVLSYFCQGVRWSLILRPLGAVRPLRATQAIYAGLFTNELLPMRVGEVVRSYLVSRWTGAAIGRVVPSIAVERLFDGFWLTVAFGLAAMAVELPRQLMRAADIMGVLVLAGAVMLAIVAWRRPAAVVKANEMAGGSGPAGRVVSGPQAVAPTASRSILGRLRGLLSHFIDELRRTARSPGFFPAALVSSGVLIFQALAFWLVMVAYGLPLSVWAGAIALLIVHLGTALPNAPGNVGSYQFFCVVGLAIFGVGKTEAAGFSLVVFVLLTVPLWVIGFVALRTSGLSLGRVRREAGGWLKR